MNVHVVKTNRKGHCLFTSIPLLFGQEIYTEPPLFFAEHIPDLIDQMSGIEQESDLEPHWYAAAIQTILYGSPDTLRILLNKWHPDTGKLFFKNASVLNL
jgi:hypothetical protein